METTVQHLLADIANQLNPPECIGLNHYRITQRYHFRGSVFIYEGKKHYVYCKQIGHRVWVYYTSIQFSDGPNTVVDLADPTSIDVLTKILQDS